MDIDYEGMSAEEAEESRRYHAEAYVNTSMRDPHRIDLAIEAYRKDLELRYKSQKRQGKRVHKGKPYFNLGLCFLYEERLDQNQAVYNLLLAYIEDLISSGDFPETAESLGAARALRQGLQFDPKVMSEIRRYPLEFPKEDREKLRDPKAVLACVMDESITQGSLAKLCQQKVLFPRKVPVNINWSNRVFIGGNYSANFGSLLKMKQVVLRKGLEPVVADDYVRPEEQTNHDFCLMLLHTCKYAIFDVTMAGGQLIEIERSRDYGTRKPLVVFNASSSDRDRPLTSGVSMLEYEMVPYRDPETDLEPLVENYLKDNP